MIIIIIIIKINYIIKFIQLKFIYEYVKKYTVL